MTLYVKHTRIWKLRNRRLKMQLEITQDTGYGLIPKRIMRDKNLSIQSKAIYSYLASFAGNTGQAFPSVSLMLGELDISRDTFYKYRNELEEVGAITIKKERSVGKFERNIYLLHNSINPPCPKSSDTVKSTTVSSTTVSSDTISNSFKSNSIKSNTTTRRGSFKEIVNLFQNNGFGLINGNTSQTLTELSEEYTDQWVLDALNICIDNNKRNLSYARAILKRWHAEGKDDGISNSKEPSTNRWAVDAT